MITPKNLDPSITLLRNLQNRGWHLLTNLQEMAGYQFLVIDKKIFLIFSPLMSASDTTTLLSCLPIIRKPV